MKKLMLIIASLFVLGNVHAYSGCDGTVAAQEKCIKNLITRNEEIMVNTVNGILNKENIPYAKRVEIKSSQEGWSKEVMSTCTTLECVLENIIARKNNLQNFYEKSQRDYQGSTGTAKRIDW